MDIRNPVYNQFGTIDCEINHPAHGWIPFTASPDDPEKFGRDLFAAIDPADVTPYVAPPPEPAPRQMVIKSLVMSRVTDAGKMPAAFATLMQQPVYFARWFAPDRPEVYCDDPDAVSLVKALGLDPAVILAP